MVSSTAVLAPAALTVSQVAEYLQVSESHVYTLIGAGTIPARKVGRCLRISRAWLDDWLAGRDESTPLDPDDQIG